MLRELMALLRGSDPLGEMHETLIEMVAYGQTMLETVWREAVAGHVRPDVRNEVERLDAMINQRERLIRRRIAEHIVLRPTTDVPTCLVLMSIVKDAERLGDYCKDILDAAALESRPLSESLCFGEFQGIYEGVRALFVKLQAALRESDKSLAEEVMLAERDIRKKCDGMVVRLAAADDPCSAGIPWALIARYLRRTAGHASNVASSLVMPLHKLDYHDPRWLEDKSKPKPRRTD